MDCGVPVEFMWKQESRGWTYISCSFVDTIFFEDELEKKRRRRRRCKLFSIYSKSKQRQRERQRERRQSEDDYGGGEGVEEEEEVLGLVRDHPREIDICAKSRSDEGFKSDIVLWCKLLLPQAAKRIYNLQSKQLVKLFSRILLQDENSMLENLEQGDIAETIRLFFESSTAVKASPKSLLTIQEVDKFLEFLSGLTKEEEQMQHFKSIIDKCTGNDLKMIIRLIKHDLRINAGPKHILNAVHEDAFKAFQVSMNLEAVVQRFLPSTSTPSTSPKETTLLTSPGGTKIALSLMTPVLPMLAEACKSVEMAMKKCCNGMFAEIKYDGERVQVHKKGIEFQYFSRSLKPVMAHKIRHFKDYIPKAFPDGDDLILDSEILLIDNKTSKPLPFGSLGVHKKSEFKDANVCLFVFDCIYYNGEVLINKSMKERRQILKSRMTEIPNRIMLSESQEVHKKKDLAEMIAKVLRLGLEGLVLKDIKSKYEPGKRHWLKVKKDYLFGGAMADSADLVVLGAWYGTGQKGGMMSIFLMGCYDSDADKWLTVTKVHSGHDDAMLEALQNKLDMIKIGKDPAKVPKWLRANKPMVPDFVARDPKKQPVWEITGAEFTNQGVHTADGISIRFPRVTRIRDDKDWSTATNLNELRELFRRSSDCLDCSILLGSNNSDKKNPKLIASTSSTPSTSGKIDKRKNISPKGVKVEKTNVDDDDKEKTKGKIKIEGRIRVKKEFHIDQPSTSRQIMKEIKTCGEENVKTKKISNLLEASYDPDIKIKEEATPIENLEHEESIIKDETDSKKDDTSAKYYSFVNNDVCIIIFLLIVIYSRIGYNTFINSIHKLDINLINDAQLFPRKVRCKFTHCIVYISKHDKFLIKFWMLTNFPYLGEEASRLSSPSLCQFIILKIVEPFTGCWRNITTDNFFTSASLEIKLLAKRTVLFGIIRSDKRESP
ncbi:DNA ligase 3 isoform X1 [Vespula maculifrons]|uniref:DNA ligase n=1 Tax=Vespula maculifrons TaxID=7453 RepID=A0ABD2CBC7_VESMC